MTKANSAAAETLSHLSMSSDANSDQLSINASNNPNASILDNLLVDVTSCATKAGLNIWLECGTLLGYVREDDFIRWEDDLDFGVMGGVLDINNKMRFSKEITQLGYEFQSHESYWHIGLPNHYCHADIAIYSLEDESNAIVRLRGVGASPIAKGLDTLVRILQMRDLGIRVEKERIRDKLKKWLSNFASRISMRIRAMLGRILTWINASLFYKDVSWRVPYGLIEELEAVTFRSVLTFIPKRAEEYLEFRYGEDWRIKRREYDTWKEDGAIVGRKNIPDHYKG